jgi:hypothetical protein
VEAARAAAPVEAQRQAETVNSELIPSDETPHQERGQSLWLGVFVTATPVLFYVGHRTQEILEDRLGEDYAGGLMSDGSIVYRESLKRLRCWAPRLRKARGLEESLDAEARPFGRKTTALLKTLMEAVYRAREGLGEDLMPRYQKALNEFRGRWEQRQEAAHEKTRARAVEFLNDWDAIFRGLAHPHLPLTHNEAEQALRHWAPDQLGYPHAGRPPSLCAAGQPHRDLPQTSSLPVALSL